MWAGRVAVGRGLLLLGHVMKRVIGCELMGEHVVVGHVSAGRVMLDIALMSGRVLLMAEVRVRQLSAWVSNLAAIERPRRPSQKCLRAACWLCSRSETSQKKELDLT